jgi:hypothetical protein
MTAAAARLTHHAARALTIVIPDLRFSPVVISASLRLVHA